MGRGHRSPTNYLIFPKLVTNLRFVKSVEKLGYVALKCWNQFKHLYKPNDIPQALVAMTLKNYTTTEWIAYIGEFDHMTYNSSMLQNLCRYLGTNAIIIDDNSTYAIIHVGDTYINNGTTGIKLQDVLLAPALAKNLLSIWQLTIDYAYNCEFYNVSFVIKEQETNCILISERQKGNLYTLSTSCGNSLLHPVLHYF